MEVVEKTGVGATQTSSQPEVEFIVRTIADTALANETYFGQLDSVVGDGDFGYSLARGFEKVIEEFPTFDRTNIGMFLRKTGAVIASRVGGTSGPIWGTAFMRAGAAAGDKTVLTSADVITMLRAAVKGIQDRGGASLGEKTLLDSLVPAIDSLESSLASNPSDGGVKALEDMAAVAERAADETTKLMAKRGRAAYTGERSIGSPDAGAVAIAVIAKSISAAWRNHIHP